MIFDEKTLAEVANDLFGKYQKLEKGDEQALGMAYYCAVKHAEHIQLHSKGDKDNPILQELLDLARPNEQQAVKNYRKGSWKSPTKSHFGRIKNSLYSIFDKRNYSISWKDDKDERAVYFMEYLRDKFPKWNSLLGYFERFLFHKILTDPNSAVLIYPLPDSDNSNLKQPFPFWFPSKKIIYHSDEYAVFIDNHGPNGENEMYVADFQSVYYGIEIIDGDKRYWEWEEVFVHGLGFVPVVKVPGEKYDDDDSLGEYGEDYQKSYIHPILEPFDKAILKASDQDGTEILHQSPKYWHFKVTCKTCIGKTTVSGAAYKGGAEVTCPTCGGSGWQKGDSPYDTIALDMKSLGKDQVSPPPGGFITPDSAILEYGKKRVDDYVSDGYSSLNMQHLLQYQSPDASGERVFQDKTEANKFLLQVSSGVWEMFRRICKVTAMEIFGPSGFYKDEMLPMVQEPIEFDVYTSADITAKYAAAKNAGADPAYLAMLQAEAIKKEFGEESHQAKSFELVLALDPFANSTTDDLLVIKTWAREEDLWLHANIKRLLQEAIMNNKAFMEMERQKQSEIIYALVDAELKARKKVTIPTDPALDPDNLN